MSLGKDQQCQAKAIKDAHELVKADAARPILKPGHQVYRNASERRSIIDAQALLLAMRPHLQSNNIGTS